VAVDDDSAGDAALRLRAEHEHLTPERRESRRPWQPRIHRSLLTAVGLVADQFGDARAAAHFVANFRKVARVCHTASGRESEADSEQGRGATKMLHGF